MSSFPPTGSVLGRCRCGQVVTDDFRDSRSRAEWTLSGLCPACQDAVFLALDDDGVLPSQPLRSGALAAHRTCGADVVEIVLLPFVFVPALHTLAWNTQSIVRIGFALPPPSHSEYDALDTLLEQPHVAVTDVASFTDPCLVDWFSDLDLLFGSDGPSLDAIVHACPALGTALRVPLADHLSPFATCIQTAAALVGSSCGPHCAPGTPAWCVLDSLRSRFPDTTRDEGS